jgi:hypothetical protein
VFLKQFDSFYITTDNKIVLRYHIGYETYMNYILGDISEYKNKILKPQKILKTLDIFPVESLVL